VRVSRDLQLCHKIIRVNLSDLGSGLLAGKSQLPASPTEEWWPFRNQFLVTVAAMAAIQINCSEVWIGTVAADRQRHSDGTAAFIQSLGKVMKLQEGSMRLFAPAVNIGSTTLLKRAKISPEILTWCHSCHTGPLACGTCPGCLKAEKTRAEFYTWRSKA